MGFYIAKKTGKYKDGTDPLDAVYTDGNVGIGVADPQAKQEIVNTNPLLPYLRIGNAIRGCVFTINNLGDVIIGASTVTSIDSKTEIVNTDPNKEFLTVSDNDASRGTVFSVSRLKRVGIGTSNPTKALDVRGADGLQAIINSTSTTGNPRIGIGQNGTERMWMRFINATKEMDLNSLQGGFRFVPINNLARAVKITNNGSFILAKYTQANRLAIPMPTVGSMVYQTDSTEGVYLYKSTGWTLIS